MGVLILSGIAHLYYTPGLAHLYYTPGLKNNHPLITLHEMPKLYDVT